MSRWWCLVLLVVACSAALDEDYKDGVGAALVSLSGRAGRSSLPAPRDFLLTSRYGRAPHLAPRNDKFFMGSRYGKRGATLYADEPAAVVVPKRPACSGVLVCALLSAYAGDQLLRSLSDAPRPAAPLVL